MTNLYHYMRDGAGAQARAVLAYLQVKEGVESSWSDDGKRYMAEPKIARWENCREQGYVISLYHHGGRLGSSTQLNIAFFEHRNSDSICAVLWCQSTMNSPTIDTAQFGEVYKTKWEVSHEVGYGKPADMADWISNELDGFWAECEYKTKETETKA